MTKKKTTKKGERVICFLFVGDPSRIGDELGEALRKSGAIEALQKAYVDLALVRAKEDARKKGRGIDAIFDGKGKGKKPIPSLDAILRREARRAERRKDLRRARRRHLRQRRKTAQRSK